MRGAALPLALLVGVLAGCGGSSSSAETGTPGFDAFLGSYRYVHFEGLEQSAYLNPWTLAVTEWGGLEADGQGSWRHTELTLNADGGVSPAILSADWIPYTLDAVHGFERGLNRPGALRADGALGATIQLTPPGIEVLVRPGGAFPAGDYAILLFQFDGGVGGDSAAWGKLTLTPAGAVTNLVFSSNANGSRADGLVGPPGTWSTAADGSVTLSVGTLDATGTVGPGGQLAVLAGSTMDGANVQVFVVLVATPAAASNALLQGDYEGFVMSGPSTAGAAPAWSVRRGRLRADGAGSLQTLAGVGSLDGRFLVPSTTFSIPTPYSVAGDGTVQTSLRNGAISPDGRTLALAGNLAPGSPPSLAFYIR